MPAGTSSSRASRPRSSPPERRPAAGPVRARRAARASRRSSRWPRSRSSAATRTSPARARPSRAAPTTTAPPSWPSTATPTATTSRPSRPRTPTIADDPWWEVDLKAEQPIDRIVVWNRTDSGVDDAAERLPRRACSTTSASRSGSRRSRERPKPSVELALSGGREPSTFAAAFADFAQAGFEAADVLDNRTPRRNGLGRRRRRSASRTR